MAPVLVATLAGANSNSYITVADATTYFDNRLDAADWTAATADNKAASLITATGWLDTLEFYGDRSATTQALKWPRTDVTCDGIEADATFIPREILDATCETALALLRNPTMLRAVVTAPGGYQEVELGELREEVFVLERVQRILVLELRHQKLQEGLGVVLAVAEEPLGRGLPA